MRLRPSLFSRLLLVSLTSLGSFATLPALADVLPPMAFETRERARNDPNTYDQADTYCKGKQIGTACTMPGTVFDGGGAGICTQMVSDNYRTIDAVCKPQETFSINRAIPDSLFVIEGYSCTDAAQKSPLADVLKREQITCTPQPLVADSFCRDLKEGDACTAQVTTRQGQQQFAGRCQTVEEYKRFYYQGRNAAVRKTLQCNSASPVQHALEKSSPPNWLQRLMQ